jgi:hypothetical protein
MLSALGVHRDEGAQEAAMTVRTVRVAIIVIVLLLWVIVASMVLGPLIASTFSTISTDQQWADCCSSAQPTATPPAWWPFGH